MNSDAGTTVTFIPSPSLWMPCTTIRAPGSTPFTTRTLPSSGKWAFSDNEMSTETATLLVRAHFPNANRLLVPNAYVTVLADEADPKPVPVVPALAVAKSGSATGVWLYNEDGTVSFREIEPGLRADGKVRVVKGVEPGARIVVQGIHKLGEGMKVTVVPASEFN